MQQPDIDISPADWAIVRSILLRRVPHYAVWAFGSRAKWTAKNHSDLDIAIITDKQMGLDLSASLADDFAESDLPFKVDIVDWAATTDSFRKIIQRDKVELLAADSLLQGWEVTTLGEICKSQGGAIQTGPFGSQLHTSDYKEFGVPVVMPTNIGDGGIVEDGIARIDQADVERLSQHKLQLGDIVFSRRGDVTKNALIRPHEVGWFCGTGCLKVRLGDESKATAKFISHCLRMPDIKDWLIRHAVGATMPNLNTGILSAVPIHLPPLKTQLEIASMLDSLDDRISLLRETNTTLEAIAQALFKSWFVDFDPVRAKQQGIAPQGMNAATAALFPDSFEESELGEVPKGWRVDSIYTAAKLIYGAPFASSKFNSTGDGKPLVRIRDLKDESPVVFTPEEHPKGYLLKPGDIVVGMDGEFRAYLWGGEEAWLNQRVCVFAPLQGFPSTFVHRAIMPILAAVEASETATTVIHLGKNDIDRFRIIVPNQAILTAFGEITDFIYKRIVEQKQMAQTLATLRDTLLPRLISGQLRLPE